ncbi:MAG: stalk domain-containing protein [Clostridia bacterium]|nr:stalk domain-containing protein [Clostridia bacterium]
MKKMICIIISLMLVLTTSFSVAYAKPNKKDKEDEMKYWKQKLKDYYKEKDKNKDNGKGKSERQEYVKQIVNIKNEYNIKANVIFINGEEVETDVPPVLKEGRVLVPIRAIVQALGAKVEWNEATGTATITKGDTVIKIKLGSDVVIVNGKEYRIDVPARSENSRIVVPVRFIAEKFHQKVEWDEETGSVIIEDGDDDEEDDDNNTSTGTNLALNKSIRSSSDYNSTYSAQKAVDGNTSTRWSSEYGSNPQWIFVDLGSVKSINKVKLIWEAAYAKEYKLYKSSDASNWTEIYSTNSGDGGTDNIVFAATDARYVKMYATARATNYGYSLYEFEVYSGSSTVNPANGYEAENASLSNGATISTNHSGYSGNGFVSGLWNQGATATFTVNVDTAGEYDVKLRYSNATGTTRTLGIYVNGTRVRQISLANLASWDNWSDATERLSLSAGNNTIAYKYDSNDTGYANLDYITLARISALTGTLSGSAAAPAYSVNLSNEGTKDWAHWGFDGESKFNHKNGVTQQIGNYSRIGSGSVNWFADNPVLFSWTGGTPNDTVSNSGTGIYVTREGNGFQLTVPADTTQKTLRLYLGAWKAKGKVTATLSDGSATEYNSYIDSSSGTTCKVISINFKAASSSQTLTVKYVIDQAYDSSYGNITLQAATLQ